MDINEDQTQVKHVTLLTTIQCPNYYSGLVITDVLNHVNVLVCYMNK